MTTEGGEHCQQFETKFWKHFHFHFSSDSFIFNFNWVNWYMFVWFVATKVVAAAEQTENHYLQMNQKIPEKQIFPSLSLFQRQHHLEHQLVECLICVRHRTAVVAAVGGWTDRKPVPKINSCPGSSFILVTTNIFANICWISNQLFDTALLPWQLVQWKFDKSRDIDLVDIARFWMTITNVGGLQRTLHQLLLLMIWRWRKYKYQYVSESTFLKKRQLVCKDNYCFV